MRIPLALLAATGLLVLAPAAFAFPDPAEMLAQADLNHDGQITRAEFRQVRDQRFDQLDRRHLGYVGLDAYPRMAMIGGRGDAMLAMVQSLDLNHDGKVTRWEFDHGPTPVFDRADLNHDNVVSRAELAALRAAGG
ncbi:EF-hand domain-containing protein [Phenylobacterium aquaticum]|uniref:EF-hand domain-containing protein n=1 Tax=Phenylobacterium aquaticum TaxID=1763816 RepID=UPI0026E99F81|nr:EF-hand domain-containing protein [Phenylobacterium aquaticum]